MEDYQRRGTAIRAARHARVPATFLLLADRFNLDLQLIRNRPIFCPRIGTRYGGSTSLIGDRFSSRARAEIAAGQDPVVELPFPGSTASNRPSPCSSMECCAAPAMCSMPPARACGSRGGPVLRKGSSRCGFYGGGAPASGRAAGDTLYLLVAVSRARRPDHPAARRGQPGHLHVCRGAFHALGSPRPGSRRSGRRAASTVWSTSASRTQVFAAVEGEGRASLEIEHEEREGAGFRGWEGARASCSSPPRRIAGCVHRLGRKASFISMRSVSGSTA